MVYFADLAALRSAVGTALGSTDWMLVDQAMVSRFAEVTGDHHWIHVDAERAGRDSPYGTTIAHGALTMAMCPAFLMQLLQVGGVRLALNPGLDKARLRAPVRVGARIRGSAKLVDARRLGPAVQVTARVTIEVEGETRPACQADQLLVLYEEAPP
jgi:acyl dehydratase